MDQFAQGALTDQPELRSWPEQMAVPHGANILLTADITRIAWLLRRSGAQKAPTALLDAFLEHVGPSGTVVVPTFNYDLKAGEIYDRERTPTISGALGQAALEHPAFARTAHPLHSFAVAGKLQPDFLALDDASSFSTGSPFALFRSGNFLLLGLDMHLNYALSYFHHVEELEAVRYRRWRDLRIAVSDQDGTRVERTYRLYAKRAGYANELTLLAPRLMQAGSMTEGTVQGVKFLRVDLGKAHDVIVNDIRSNKARSIVRFTWRNWLRDTLHAVMPSRKPSRSVQLLNEQDAGVL